MAVKIFHSRPIVKECILYHYYIYIVKVNFSKTASLVVRYDALEYFLFNSILLLKMLAVTY